MTCDFLIIDGTQVPGVASMRSQPIVFRNAQRAISGLLRVSRLGNAAASRVWTIGLNGLTGVEKQAVTNLILGDVGVRSVQVFTHAMPFAAIVNITDDRQAPQWADGTPKYDGGGMTITVEAVGTP